MLKDSNLPKTIERFRREKKRNAKERREREAGIVGQPAGIIGRGRPPQQHPQRRASHGVLYPVRPASPIFSPRVCEVERGY